MELSEERFLFFKEAGLICSLGSGRPHLIDLNEPKILPCGFNACCKCIKKKRSFTKRLECSFCNSVHKINRVSLLPTNNDLIIIFKNKFLNLLNSLNVKQRHEKNGDGE